MNKYKFSNAAATCLVLAIAADATSLQLQDASSFPENGPFPVRIEGGEICMCTARTGNVLTVTRAAEGTTAVAHDAGEIVYVPFTAGTAQAFVQRAVVTAEASPVAIDCSEADIVDFSSNADIVVSAPTHPVNGGRVVVRLTNTHGSQAKFTTFNGGFLFETTPGALIAGGTRRMEAEYHAGLAKWLVLSWVDF